jgi:hypothetical protein
MITDNVVGWLICSFLEHVFQVLDFFLNMFTSILKTIQVNLNSMCNILNLSGLEPGVLPPISPLCSLLFHCL